MFLKIRESESVGEKKKGPRRKILCAQRRVETSAHGSWNHPEFFGRTEPRTRRWGRPSSVCTGKGGHKGKTPKSTKFGITSFFSRLISAPRLKEKGIEKGEALIQKTEVGLEVLRGKNQERRGEESMYSVDATVPTGGGTPCPVKVRAENCPEGREMAGPLGIS